MTILFVGGEDTSFNSVFSPGLTVDSTDPYFDPAWARCSLTVGGQPFNSGRPTIPSPVRLRTTAFAVQTSLWVHGMHSNAGNNAQGGPVVVHMAAVDSGGVNRLVVLGTGSAGQLSLNTVNAAGTVTTLATSVVAVQNSQNAPLAYDWFINYGTSGSSQLYINGTLVLTYSGNLVTDSCPGIVQADYCGAASYNVSGFWSEMIVSTTDTRGQRVFTIAPTTLGSADAWGGSVAAINKVAINDGTFNSTSTAGQLAEYNTPVTLPTGTWAIAAVAQEARLRIGTGPQNFQHALWTVDAAVHTSATVAGTSDFNNAALVWPTNPSTGVAWVPADLGTGFALGVKSIA